MENDQTKNAENLKKACNEAYDKYPDSCSTAAWHVIKQYKADQKFMVANELVDHLSKSSDWEEVQLSELSKLASNGDLVVGGAKEKGNGHVVVVYPGNSKESGGFHYLYKGKDTIKTSDGDYALAMSTSMGSWPGAKSNGDKTVRDAWGKDAKFNAVRFWKYVGPIIKDSKKQGRKDHELRAKQAIDQKSRPATALRVHGPILKRGDNGAAVKQLQEKLNSASAFPKLQKDSNFGQHTEDAVKYFQRKNHLKANGVVDEGTQAALGMIRTSSSPWYEQISRKFHNFIAGR